jgi:putative pyruvate formate lyase activating enzyme
MIILQGRGAYNINMVTGTPHVPHIIEAVALARHQGLTIPVVWNTSGYETLDTIDRLKGTVDIYLTDIKYGDDTTARALSDADDYFSVATAAAGRMIEQVGPLETDRRGIGQKGVIIRHLVLPNGLSNTGRVMTYIRKHFGTEVPVSLMGQYFPAHRASTCSGLQRPITRQEYERARRAVEVAGVTRGWFQEMDDPAVRRGA